MLLKKGDTILFVGDSITDCSRSRNTDIYAWAPLHHGNGYVSDVEAALVLDCPQLCPRILNMGISDNTILHLKERWQTDVLDWNADWVFVMIGINDVWKQFQYPNVPDKCVQIDTYEAVYRELIEKTKDTARHLVLVTPYYLETNREDPMRVRMEAYSDVVRRLAQEYGLLLVDMQKAWDALLTYIPTQQLSYDRVHPNHIGHVYMARQILNVLLDT